MASNYVYKVLTSTQIKLLDEYTPWAYKVRLSELLDQALEGEVTGHFISLDVDLDIVGGRDLYITREGYFGQSLHVGGGYGDTGLSVDQFGNLVTDGFIDCTIAGIRMREETIPTSATVGVKGEQVFGSPDAGVTWYIYQCVADNTWGRVALDLAF